VACDSVPAFVITIGSYGGAGTIHAPNTAHSY